jgi:hypothetical protein
MAMDWDRSGDDEGAASWRARMAKLTAMPGPTANMVRGAGLAIPHSGQVDAFFDWLAHVDAGRIGEGVR